MLATVSPKERPILSLDMYPHTTMPEEAWEENRDEMVRIVR
jgi:hypothetical protein